MSETSIDNHLQSMTYSADPPLPPSSPTCLCPQHMVRELAAAYTNKSDLAGQFTRRPAPAPAPLAPASTVLCNFTVTICPLRREARGGSLEQYFDVDTGLGRDGIVPCRGGNVTDPGARGHAASLAERLLTLRTARTFSTTRQHDPRSCPGSGRCLAGRCFERARVRVYFRRCRDTRAPLRDASPLGGVKEG